MGKNKAVSRDERQTAVAMKPQGHNASQRLRQQRKTKGVGVTYELAMASAGDGGKLVKSRRSFKCRDLTEL